MYRQFVTCSNVDTSITFNMTHAHISTLCIMHLHVMECSCALCNLSVKHYAFAYKFSAFKACISVSLHPICYILKCHKRYL
jgi:hypothetical protein